jgi:hypothetical protein
MMTVRFPNGQAVQYNDANFISWGNDHSTLYNEEPNQGGQLIARVPRECIIEWEKPCRVYNPISSAPNEELEALKKEVQALKRLIYRKKNGK